MSWSEDRDHAEESFKQKTNGNKKKSDDWEEQLQQEQGSLEASVNEKISALKDRFGSCGSGCSDTNVKLWLVLIAFLWLLSGIFVVSPAEQAVVTRFGKFAYTLEPGMHWILRGVESERRVNVRQVYHFNYGDAMLTRDENIVNIELAVQYRTGNAKQFLFNVRNPIVSLKQATASALRQVIGHTTLDETLTTGRVKVRDQVQRALQAMMASYQTGIEIDDVALLPAKPPEAVTIAFDDAIKAREDEQRYINNAKAYAMKVKPIAEGKAARLIRAAEADRQKLVLEATAKTADFLAILPEYTRSPEVTQSRLYLDTMEHVLTRTSKVYLDTTGSGNMVYLPLDKIMQQHHPDHPMLAENHAKVSNERPVSNALSEPKRANLPVPRVGYTLEGYQNEGH